MQLLKIKSCVQSLSFLLIFLYFNQQTSATVDCMIELLIKQIKIHQVIALINDVKYAKLETSIIQKVTSRYPSQTLSSNSVGRLTMNRSSILFVSSLETTLPPYNAELEFTKKLRDTAWDTFNSKFLLFVFSEDEDRKLEYLLKFAWEQQLINIILYQIDVGRTHSNLKIVHSNPLAFPGKIHRYNPFTQYYYQEIFNPNMAIYPNMVLNLQGYKLRIGLVHYPPYSDIVEDENTKVVEYKAVFGQLIKAIRKVVNFTISPVVRPLSAYGVLLKNGSATGMLADIKDGKLDIIAFGGFYFYSEFTVMLDRTSYLSMEEACPVVPMIPTTSILLNISFVISCLTILILITAIWLFTFILKPDKKNKTGIWQPLNVGFLILGIAVPNQPINLRERIVYGCILVVSLFYSSNVIAQLTSINFDTNSFVEFESFKDLDKSGLIPIVHPNMFNMTFSSDDESLQRLGKRAEPRTDYAEYCPNRLQAKGDVICVIEDLCARHLIKQTQVPTTHEPRMKFGKPCFWSATRAYILRKASPYTSRFNEVIMRVIESDIGSMWWQNYYAETKISQENNQEESDENNLEDQLKDTSYKSTFFVVLFGNLASVCVFFGELLIFRWKSKRAAKVLKVKVGHYE